MPIDASIVNGLRPIQLENPMQQVGNVLAIQGGMNRNALTQMQMQQAQRAMADADRRRAALSDPNMRLEDVPNALLRMGDVEGAMSTRNSLLTGNKTEAETAKARAETAKAWLSNAREMLSGVNDQAGYDAWRSQVVSQVPQFAQLPAQFTPQLKRDIITKADDTAKQLTPDIKEVTDGQRKFFVDVNPNTNPEIRNMKVQLVATPGEVLTDTRSRATLAEQQRHNRVTESNAAATLAAGKAPAGYRFKADGTLEAIAGGPAEKDKALTEAQGKATGFALRATEANKILNALEGRGVANTGIIKSIVSGAGEMVPFIGDKVGNALGAGMNAVPGVLGGPNADQQKTEQARRDFVNAVLRVESGATITPPEFENASRQYFPQPGDTKQVIEQKRRNRETAIQALKAQAGPGAAKIPEGWTVTERK